MSKVVRFLGSLLVALSLFFMNGIPAMANGQPDLEPTAITVTTLYPGVTNTVQVTVANNEATDVDTFDVTLYVDGAEVDTVTVTPYGWWPATASLSWTPTAVGSYNLTVTVDPLDTIDETNETNNDFGPETVDVTDVAPVTVTVRVEGQTSTIWSGNVTFTTSTITDKYGATYTLDYPTAMGAIHAASAAGGFSLVVDSMFASIDYVESVDGEIASYPDGWMYRVNWDSPNFGAKEYAVSDNDTILWSYTQYGSQPLHTTVSSNSVLYGNSFDVTVEAYDGTSWNAAEDVTVYAGTLTYTTDASGQVLNLALNPGSYTVYADKGDCSVNIRSNQETVIVYVPLTLKAGWNFISVPKRLASGYSTAQQVFGSVDTAGHSIFTYDGTNGWTAMSSDNVVSPLEGIWIYSASEVELHPAFDTDPLQVPPTKQLAAGWNAIGFSDFTAASADSALTSVEASWTVLIGFDADNQTYEVSIINNAPTGDAHDEDREMNCWKGYWLHGTTACQLAAISS